MKAIATRLFLCPSVLVTTVSLLRRLRGGSKKLLRWDSGSIPVRGLFVLHCPNKIFGECN